MIKVIQNFKTVVLADGDFPQNPVPLSFLQNAKKIICCDGATENLVRAGFSPDFIVGDMDSIPKDLKTRFTSIITQISEQETNDLTKSVTFAVEKGLKEITVLGATGKREDHTLGNLSLLADYAEKADIQMLTEHGVFVAVDKSAVFESFPGQQVSIFSFDPRCLITTSNLAYPIKKRGLTSWWQGTLNESTSDTFTIEFSGGKLLVFRKYC